MKRHVKTLLSISIALVCILRGMEEKELVHTLPHSLDSIPIELQKNILELAIQKIFESNTKFSDILEKTTQLLKRILLVNKKFRSLKTDLIKSFLEQGNRYLNPIHNTLNEAQLNQKLEAALKGYNTKIDKIKALQAIFAGADPNLLIGSDVGKPRSVLGWACLWPSSELTTLLLIKGANPNFQNDFGYTPLMLIALVPAEKFTEDFIKIIKILLKWGANTDLVNKKHETALSIAKSEGKKSMVELLSRQNN